MVDFKKGAVNGEYLYTLPPDQNGSQVGGEQDDLPGLLINPTGPLGFISLLYIKTMFQLPKFGYGVYRYMDTFEINPTYREYYAATIAQKQDLENKIKAGLESASRAIGDYELLAHDHRKYQEYLRYLNDYETAKKFLGDYKDGKTKLGKEEADKKKSEADRLLLESNTSLKAIFIDQVDVHTGEGVALKLIVSRWPNIIVDFMKMENDMTTSEDIVKRLVPKITTAEAVVLATKNKLFTRWKDLFKTAVTQRYLNIMSLMNARRKSIEQYKKWLRPYVIQHELLKESQETPGAGGKSLTHRLKIGAHAMSFHDIGVYAWQPFTPGDMFRATVERKEIDVRLEHLGRKEGEKEEDEAILKKFGLEYNDVKGGKFTTTFWINPYDHVAKEALFGSPKGQRTKYIKTKPLCDEYPWINKKELEAQAIRIIKESEKQPKNYMNTLVLHPDYLYYMLWDLVFSRVIISVPQGTADDCFVFVKIIFVSQNVMLTKLVDRWCYEQKFDRNVEEILGLTAIDEKEDTEAGITGDMESVAKKRFPLLYGKEKTQDKPEPVSIVKSMERKINEIENALQIFGIQPQLFKKGPYETNLKDRFTRQFSKAFADTFRAEFIDWFEDAARIGD